MTKIDPRLQALAETDARHEQLGGRLETRLVAMKARWGFSVFLEGRGLYNDSHCFHLHRTPGAAVRCADKINRGLKLAKMSSYERAFVHPAVEYRTPNGDVDTITSPEHMVAEASNFEWGIRVREGFAEMKQAEVAE